MTIHPGSRFGASAPGLSSWYWDVEQDRLWTGPALAGAWLGERDPDAAVPICDWLERLLEGRQHELADFVDAVRRSDRGEELRTEVRAPSGWLAVGASVAEADAGKAKVVVGYLYDLTRYRQAEVELRFHERFLHQVGSGEPLGDVLDTLCHELEKRLPGVRTAVLVHDRDAARLWHAAAPSFGSDYISAVDGIPVANHSAVSGTAAHRRVDVIVRDTEADHVVDGFRHLVTTEGTRAVWSHPLVAAEGSVLGTITVHHPTPGGPSDDEIALVTRYGYLATLAIQRALLSPQLLRATNIDHQTGLPNRGSFLELVNRWLAESDEELGVLVVDVEGYHQLGAGRHHLDIEAILLQVAQRLGHLVGEHGVIGAVDAERFGVAVALPSRGDVMGLARRLLRAFDEPVSVNGAAFHLAASVGVAYGLDTDAPTLLGEATVALHAARSEGLGAVRAYDDAMRSGMQARLEREADLRRGIEAEEFTLVYQPTYSVERGTFDRAEALVRWNHPVRGLVPPDEFMPLAEQTGLMAPLGGLILRQAVAQAKEWRERFPDLKLWINVSAAQLANPTFADEVAALVEDAGVPMAALSIEVTESGLMENLDVARATLDRFVELGLHVLVDDFGTGHSSLARLDEIPVHALKIDKRFIQRLTTDPVAPTVVGAIIEVARAHGLRVTAEGVEDAETATMVAELGCHYSQGYHFCRPMTPADTEKFLTSFPA